MVSKDLLVKYAKLAVRTGVNLQPGQPLIINCAVENAEFARLCVREAYEAGASDVNVRWSDDEVTHDGYVYRSLESLQTVAEWQIELFRDWMSRGGAILHISAPTPGLLGDIDPKKVSEAMKAQSMAMREYRAYTMGNKGQWSIVSVPTVAWSRKVFPSLSDEEAVKAMWKEILAAVRVNETTDPIAAWDLHNTSLAKHNKQLNDFNFKHLHFKNGHGTDVVIGLVPHHIWAGGSEKAMNGFVFNPNMPTEETFTMPSVTHVEGTIHATKPLSYNGHVIDNFWIKFENGRAVSWDAEQGLDILTALLESDEGSRHLGEVALISHDSPISNSNVLFYNTLFDENASCHVALGKAYPMNVKGGLDMSLEALKAAGANDSMNHVDFMFGSEDMSIVGLTQDDQEVVVFANGNFVF